MSTDLISIRREKHARWIKEYNKSNREQLLEILGNKCIKCGFNDPRALQLDHINGGGTKEMKQMINTHCMIKYYLMHQEEIVKRIQILCANCNWIKRHEKDENVSRKYL